MTIRQSLATLNLNRRGAAKVLSEIGRRPPSPVERFGLGTHLVLCRSCRRHRADLQRAATDDGGEPSPAQRSTATAAAPPLATADERRV